MLHQVGVSFDLYYDARKHKIKMWYMSTPAVSLHGVQMDRFCPFTSYSLLLLVVLQTLVHILKTVLSLKDYPTYKNYAVLIQITRSLYTYHLPGYLKRPLHRLS